MSSISLIISSKVCVLPIPFSFWTRNWKKLSSQRITNPSFHVHIFLNIRDYMCNFLTLIEILMSYNEILLHYGFFFFKKRQIVSKINMLVLVFFNPLANVSMIWEIYHRRWSVANIVLCLVLIALCDTGHVSYHHNQPLKILWFLFLTKFILF